MKALAMFGFDTLGKNVIAVMGGLDNKHVFKDLICNASLMLNDMIREDESNSPSYKKDAAIGLFENKVAFVTDENGNYVKDDSGNFETEEYGIDAEDLDVGVYRGDVSVFSGKYDAVYYSDLFLGVESLYVRDGNEFKAVPMKNLYKALHELA